MVPCIDDELAFGEVFCKSQFLNIDEQSWTMLIEASAKQINMLAVQANNTFNEWCKLQGYDIEKICCQFI